MIALRITAGPRVGELIDLDGETTIGRHDGDVLIDDDRMSRRHLKVRPVDGELLVEDLGSTNGTLVDDRRIVEPTRVGNGARVRLGATVLEVVVTPEACEMTRADGPLADAGATLLDGPEHSRDGTAQPPARARDGERPLPAVAVHSLVGAFQPASPRRRRGLASRSWIPVALSFGSAFASAAALVIYFAQR